MTDKPRSVRARFIAAQAAMSNAALNQTNPHFRSKYADLGAVRDATLEALNAEGLGISHSFGVGDGVLLVLTEIFDAEGETLKSVFPVPFDKPQQMGSGITYAKRYNWSALCAIAAEEDDDANEAQKREALRAPAKTKPKAESRDDYTELTDGIRACETRGALQAWAVTNRTAIDLLPDSWQKNLRDEYARQLESLAE